MSEYLLTIDGKQVKAGEGTTVLQAARSAGVDIPTLCHHPELVAYGGCRLCIVEASGEGWSKLVTSCVHPVDSDLTITTRSDKIDRIRKTLIELLLTHAPDAPQLLELSEAYGADRHRFVADPSFCIHCGLCVRYCHEVVGLDAVGFIDRGVRKEISFVPDLAAEYCNDCKRCFPLCPTSYLQAAFVLVESWVFPR